MKNLMARCLNRWLALRQRVYLTPREFQARVAAAEQQLAVKRTVLDESIKALVKARVATTANVFEVKLTINRAALRTCHGELAAINIAATIAKEIIRRHHATEPKPQPKETL